MCECSNHLVAGDQVIHNYLAGKTKRKKEKHKPKQIEKNQMNKIVKFLILLAVASTVFAASEKYQKMTGTVVASDIQNFEIEAATKEHGVFHSEGAGLKVGEKVTVYYDPSLRDRRGSWFPEKIEKVGKAEGGSKK